MKSRVFGLVAFALLFMLLLGIVFAVSPVVTQAINNGWVNNGGIIVPPSYAPAAQAGSMTVNNTFNVKQGNNSAFQTNPVESPVNIKVTTTTGAKAVKPAPVPKPKPKPTSVPPTSVPPTSVPPTSVPPTSVPPTSVPPTSVPPTSVPPTSVPPTSVPPTSVPPTSVPPTSVPPTSVPPTSVPPTSVPPTSVPPTSVPPTSVPPTSVPPTTPTPKPKYKLSNFVIGASIYALLGGIDEFVASKSDIEFNSANSDDWEDTTIETAGGAVGGFVTYSMLTMGAKLGSSVSTKLFGAGATSKVFTAGVGWSILGGMLIGGTIGEYRLVNELKESFAKGMSELDSYYTADAKYVNDADSDALGIKFYDNSKVNKDGYLTDIIYPQNRQVSIKLKNSKLNFIKEIKQADVAKGTLPEITASDEKNVKTTLFSISNLPKFSSLLYSNKLLFTEPEKVGGGYSGWDKFYYYAVKSVDWASAGLTSMRRDIIVQSAENWEKMLKSQNPQKEGSIRIFSSSGTNPVVIDNSGYFCNPLDQYNNQVVTCEVHKELADGIYVLDRRQFFGVADSLSMVVAFDKLSNEGFENAFENNYCGSLTLVETPAAKKFFCNVALSGMYESNTGSFTDEGKKDVEAYLGFVEQYYNFITEENSLGINFVKDVFPSEDLAFMQELIAMKGNWTKLAEHKYFLATALYGLPTFSIITSGDVSNAFEKYSGDLFSDPNASKYVEGKSILYYIKLLNSNLVNSSLNYNKVTVKTN